MPLVKHAESLERLYGRYNRREFIHPDPLEVLYDYSGRADREVAGLVAASLAYGRVAQILKSVRRALEIMGPEPAGYVRKTPPAKMRRDFAAFRHRFTGGADLAATLAGLRKSLRKAGTVQKCFTACLRRGDSTVAGALERFVAGLDDASGGAAARVLSDPRKGGPCKRLNLYLRWMVRHDDVDPGCWKRVDPALLIVPLDTHMHRIGKALGAVGNGGATMKAAMALTAAFARVSPTDPVRYDFALTRLGIRRDADMGGFLAACGIGSDHV